MNKNETRYMKNPDTGVIFAYCAEDMRANRKLVECTADGVVFGKSTTPTDELYARIAELERMIEKKNIRIEALESTIATMEGMKDDDAAANGENKRKELEDLKVEDLKTLAADLGLPTDGKKADLTAAILAASEKME